MGYHLNNISIDTAFSSKKEYKKELKSKQIKLLELQRKFYNLSIPIIIVFEGWDASGKGGAIKRLTEGLDPRGISVHSISAPDSHELKYNYLRRFWKLLPKTGHLCIFDRSWYGRVLVERVENFATSEEWLRAYDEINSFENILINDNHIIIKFFIHITKDEQLKRFEDRRDNPLKSWKLTDEDWRNREKWDLYEEAIEEMVEKTSTPVAPWHLIHGNDKLKARIKVIDTVIERLESFLELNNKNH